jgi:tetratricopeptide (TPR) repeat protein
VRDQHGNPIEAEAVVHLTSPMLNIDSIVTTQGSTGAQFSSLAPGEYTVVVDCPGFHKVTENLSLVFGHSSLPVFIYLIPESMSTGTGASSPAYILTQQLRVDMQKGMDALNKEHYDAAKKIFAKVSQKAPGNPDVYYYMGVAELGLQHFDVALDDFKHTLSLDTNHELALVSLGHLQLRTGASADAVISLEKAVALGRAGWRANYELAFAYVKVNRLSDAEAEAKRAVHVAKDKGAAPLYLLGEIQAAEGKRDDAKVTLGLILKTYPADPAVPEAKKMLAQMENESPADGSSPNASLPLPAAPNVSLVKVVEHPWAPPDTDSAGYDVAPNENCKTELILDAALHRMNSDLTNFEKFSATEHIERQDIDRYGWPGPVRTHDYPYIVFVYPLGSTSFYVREFRSGEDDKPDVSEVITSTNLNSMGVNVLQPYYRQRFDYSCEGLSNVRGQAAWQIHFVEKRDAKGEGVRTWQLNYETFQVPVKGRIWISSVSFAVLRVETDLRDPVKKLELTKDHLLVDYGPVNFSSGNKQLWLPWSAESYMERSGKRYHHRHLLSNYLLFNVDTTHNVGKPKEPTEPPAGSTP